MTPKEKAEELLHKYRMLFMNEGEDYGEEILVSILSEKCALIAVDECINIHYNLESDRNGIGESYKYWQEVKQEIEKL